MTQPKFKIKKGDQVQVVVGSDSGKRGIVKKMFLEKGKALVEGVNIVVRNVKPDYKHSQGAYKKEMPISISNLSLIDPSTDKPAKIGYKLDETGKKVRYFKKSGVVV
ncbi:MAG: 50S ribosomal protein L24 [Holosporales bacterium]|jgi:large subunit ribosomal protein L24|nr:50S ribosomal protein L24 [Holosporales bacterium]